MLNSSLLSHHLSSHFPNTREFSLCNSHFSRLSLLAGHCPASLEARDRAAGPCPSLEFQGLKELCVPAGAAGDKRHQTPKIRKINKNQGRNGIKLQDCLCGFSRQNRIRVREEGHFGGMRSLEKPHGDNTSNKRFQSAPAWDSKLGSAGDSQTSGAQQGLDEESVLRACRALREQQERRGHRGGIPNVT